MRKTFELVATTGPAQNDLDAVFAPLAADPQGSLDGVRDMANMLLQDKPEQVRVALDAMLATGRPRESSKIFSAAREDFGCWNKCMQFPVIT